MAESTSPQRPLLASQIFNWAERTVVPTAVGHVRPFFDSPTQTFRNLECHATTLNAFERSHEPHRHSDEELVVVKEGVLEVMINGRVEQAPAGAVVFFASNDFHGLKNAGERPVSYHVIRVLVG